MGTFLRVFFLVVLLGGLVVGLILVGQRQLLIKEAANISIPILTKPTPTPSPTPGPDAGSATFTVRFQGISSAAAEKVLRITFNQGDTAVYSFTNIPMSASPGGTYSGKINGINPGAYDVHIRGEAHLLRKFPNISIVTGQNTLDFTSKILLAGDFDGDNRINVNDVGILSANIKSPPAMVDPSNRLFDVDGSGLIDNSDLDIVLSNYKGLEVLGE